eukprot:TRINITY_DN17671_c0_g1_i1.p1 TRINITY_DN17671_c0_g1~~TRINITY_DN17671_c0_g1_i1.p1  ORF type:complete len:530 (+),score=74.77 TRINITY_DN17671_c0_g1_i1:144-1733(+)
MMHTPPCNTAPAPPRPIPCESPPASTIARPSPRWGKCASASALRKQAATLRPATTRTTPPSNWYGSVVGQVVPDNNVNVSNNENNNRNQRAPLLQAICAGKRLANPTGMKRRRDLSKITRTHLASVTLRPTTTTCTDTPQLARVVGRVIPRLVIASHVLHGAEQRRTRRRNLPKITRSHLASVTLRPSSTKVTSGISGHSPSVGCVLPRRVPSLVLKSHAEFERQRVSRRCKLPKAFPFVALRPTTTKISSGLYGRSVRVGRVLPRRVPRLVLKSIAEFEKNGPAKSTTPVHTTSQMGRMELRHVTPRVSYSPIIVRQPRTTGKRCNPRRVTLDSIRAGAISSLTLRPVKTKITTGPFGRTYPVGRVLPRRVPPLVAKSHSEYKKRCDANAALESSRAFCNFMRLSEQVMTEVRSLKPPTRPPPIAPAPQAPSLPAFPRVCEKELASELLSSSELPPWHRRKLPFDGIHLSITGTQLRPTTTRQSSATSLGSVVAPSSSVPANQRDERVVKEIRIIFGLDGDFRILVSE